jgi:hypothetical protein
MTAKKKVVKKKSATMQTKKAEVKKPATLDANEDYSVTLKGNDWFVISQFLTNAQLPGMTVAQAEQTIIPIKHRIASQINSQ